MESNNLTQIISISYLIICFAIPIIYLFLFYKHKAKKKNYAKAIFIAICMFFILFSIKLLLKLDIAIFEYPNCYINNICNKEDEKINTDNKQDKEKTTKKMTSTTILTTTNTTTTTTTKKVNSKTYEKVAEISGEKKTKGTSTKGYTIYEIDGVTYVDGYLIANKSYFLPQDFVPTDTYTKADGNATRQCATCINNTAYKAYKDMKADAAAVGLNIYISSGFRSYITQSNIYTRYVNKDGKEKADTYSARPGSSEHQTGLCFDLNSITDEFAYTNEGKWVDQNAWKYGYIIRYPKGKNNETGYKYEPWHLRYVGTELAKELYNNGNWITIEDYFGLKSEYTE